jgi:hypothetical protein
MMVLGLSLALVTNAISQETGAAGGDKMLTRVADTFKAQDWTTATDTRVTADIQTAEEGLNISIPYDGTGFQFYRMEPVNPIAIPGKIKAIEFRIRMGEPSAGAKLVLLDGKGEQVDLELKGVTPGEWATATASLPDNLVSPVSISSFIFHNWGTRNEKTTVAVDMADLKVTTDLSRVDPKTGEYLDWKAPIADAKPPETPLFSTQTGSTQPGNFFAGETPELTLVMRNWRPDPAQVSAQLSIENEAGESVFEKTEQTTVEATGELRWKFEPKQYGPYRAVLSIDRDGTEKREVSMRLAYSPQPRVLTEEEKMSSPIGMNYHAGHGLLLAPFRKAGIVWFRDYAFSWEWLKRAKGNDHSFSGWPGYPGILKAYQDSGGILMPCMAQAIPEIKLEDGKVVGDVPPDRDWIAHLGDVLGGFQNIRYWELDNEYALEHEVREALEINNWTHYERYHQKFGDAVKILGNEELFAVENGRAGIFPELLLKAVQNGSFDNIQVANIHHYCGVDAPEENIRNANTGGLGVNAKLYFDKLRDTVANADADGKDREVFITEFGWDTKAGQVVSEAEQAAYLARAYMIHAAAGLDKSFWYWHFDSETAGGFFAGCGLMTFEREPKPALPAMAGMTQIIPDLNYIGDFYPGPGTMGYIFRQDGKLVAAAWSIREPGEDNLAVDIDFGAGAKLYDLYANPLKGTKATLGIAPVYAVGVAEDSPWVKQSQYSIASDHLMLTTAGEESVIRLKLENRFGKTLQGRVEVALPEGWIAPEKPVSFTVGKDKGQLSEVEIPVQVPHGVKPGIEAMSLAVYEGDAAKPLSVMPLQANVREPFFLSVGPMPVKPGKVDVVATVVNQANSVQNPQVTLDLPGNWKSVSGPQILEGLKPGESRDVTLTLDWEPKLDDGSKAQVVVKNDTTQVAQPMIPPIISLKKVGGSGWFDGDVSQWPEANRLPGWMVGSTYGEPRADFWLGWTDQGLWAAVAVRESKTYVTDPRSFWQGDVLELFIDGNNDKTAKDYGSGDHQFWVVPQPQDQDVFVGQWKRGKEIADTRYDISGIQSASAKTETGFTMEFIIPWSELKEAQGKSGEEIGFNLSFTIKGTDGDRQVYWPRRKDAAVMGQPSSWGTVKLEP